MFIADAFLAHSMVIHYTITGIRIFVRTRNGLYAVGCSNSALAATLYLANTHAYKNEHLHVFVQLNGMVSMMCYLMASPKKIEGL
jgi:hypothetical protein